MLNGVSADMLVDRSGKAVLIDDREYDPQFIILKFKDWKTKMTCSTCMEHENDVILPCGHMLC